MKKIGIITYWQVANYGAWIQAYSLNNVVQKLFPDNRVEHIAYLEKSHWESYYSRDLKGLNNFMYNWDCITHSEELDEQSIDSYECDILITGSDSIWEEINSGVINFDKHLVGMGFKNVNKIISYAPSSGIIENADMVKEEMKIGLQKYKHISVRDESTQKMVKQLTGMTPKIVLDPSLLWDFYDDPAVKGPAYKRYIAVYGSCWSSDFIKKATTFARENDYLLISIGFINEWCDVNFKRMELRTQEWLGFIRDAEYVFTSTFHGLMMGINFKKQIRFCQVENVKNRSQTLIEELEIANAITNFDSSIDYNQVDTILNKMRVDSLSWLRGAILN